jgi:hypothetical protein
MARNDGRHIVQRFNEMKSGRLIWEGLWQDLKDYVRPSTDDFYRYTSKGKSQVDKIFDGTALWALGQLAAGLNSFLTSPTQRWFALGIEGRPSLTNEEMSYLELVSDEVYSEYQRPEVNFAPSIHEIYMDIGAFGTAVIFQDYNTDNNHIMFNAFPLVECFVSEDDNGIIDTLGRLKVMTALQIRKRFGENMPPSVADAIRKGTPNREFQVLHITFPREDRDVWKYDKLNKPFASVWVLLDEQEIIRESGFDSFPYHVPRWTKLSGETYGRSPAMDCLPDIRMVNAMAKTLIKGAQKIVDPALLVPNESVIGPVRTSPGSLIYYESGSDVITPLNTNGRVDIGIDFISYHRDRIVKSFFVDWLIRNKKKERQTTTEIADDRDEMLRQMSPMLGRLQVELLGPMLARTFDLMVRHNRIPSAPETLDGGNYEIQYISPAALAQFGGKAIQIQRFIQDVAQFASVKPEVLDRIDADAAVVELARYRDVSRKILFDDEQVAQIRRNRAIQQQEMQQMQMGEQMASALKDASVANKNFQ